jgi:hypothetical protein
MITEAVRGSRGGAILGSYEQCISFISDENALR